MDDPRRVSFQLTSGLILSVSLVLTSLVLSIITVSAYREPIIEFAHYTPTSTCVISAADIKEANMTLYLACGFTSFKYDLDCGTKCFEIQQDLFEIQESHPPFEIWCKPESLIDFRFCLSVVKPMDVRARKMLLVEEAVGNLFDWMRIGFTVGFSVLWAFVSFFVFVMEKNKKAIKC